MGFRDSLNNNPGVTTGATVGIIVVMLGVIVWRLIGADTSSYAPPSTKAFFSDDDGATFFVDERTKVPPFDHNGKTAYAAEVFTCDGGKTLFVGWLRRYTAEGKRRREAQLAHVPGKPPAGIIDVEDFSGVEIKRPRTGDKGWVKEIDAAADAIRDVSCPDGSKNNIEPAMPPE